MGKITVKHYLNTNLKPYIVRGEKYYTVYMLITVNRKTTKVPSKEFGELQTEKEFEEILLSNELENEVKTVENIISSQLRVFNDNFDTLLFSALYNLFPNYYISDSNSLFALSDINTHNDIYMQNGWSFYDWYKPDVQIDILESLKNSLYDRYNFCNDIISLNDAVLIGFFNIISIVTPSISKYKELKNKYDLFCKHPEDFTITYLYKK